MRISKDRLRQLIREELGNIYEVGEQYIPAHLRRNNPMERAYFRAVEDYEDWLPPHLEPSDPSSLAAYLIDQDLEQNIERRGILSSEYSIDKAEVARELEARSAESATSMDPDSDADDAAELRDIAADLEAGTIQAKPREFNIGDKVIATTTSWRQGVKPGDMGKIISMSGDGYGDMFEIEMDKGGKPAIVNASDMWLGWRKL